MIIVALVRAYPAEAEARAACAAEHGHGDLPYMGIWVHPTAERPLVHIFSNQTSDQLEAAGWTPGGRVTDDEIVKSARGMIIDWMGEWALMLRVDQTPDQLGLDAQNRVIERHIDHMLSVRAALAEIWGWPAPPAPFPFQERDEVHR